MKTFQRRNEAACPLTTDHSQSWTLDSRSQTQDSLTETLEGWWKVWKLKVTMQAATRESIHNKPRLAQVGKNEIWIVKGIRKYPSCCSKFGGKMHFFIISAPTNHPTVADFKYARNEANAGEFYYCCCTLLNIYLHNIGFAVNDMVEAFCEACYWKELNAWQA